MWLAFSASPDSGGFGVSEAVLPSELIPEPNASLSTHLVFSRTPLPSMTLEELDRELSSWQQATLAIVNNVYDLYEHPTYKTLAGAGRPPAKLTGSSKQRADTAVSAVKDLLDLSLSLDHVVKHAVSLRADLPLLFQSDRISEIEQLLHGASIKLQEAQTPLAHRHLLSQSVTSRAISPQNLLDVMLPAFDAAKATIVGIDEAWTTLPVTLDALEAEASALESRATSNGISGQFDFAGIRSAIIRARAAVMEDPLVAVNGVNSNIRARISEHETRLQSLLFERDNIAGELATAKSSLTMLDELHRRATSAQEERFLKVELPDSLPPCPSLPAGAQIQALREWHGKLEAAVNRGEWQPARIGLSKWRDALSGVRQKCEQALQANERTLSDRRELRGRLDALKAKAAACGRSEDASLGALEREASALFQRRPTPLVETAAVIAKYQQELTRILSARS